MSYLAAVKLGYGGTKVARALNCEPEECQSMLAPPAL
jgi:hypothetical protein